MKKTRKRYSLRISFLKDLSFTFLIPFLAILLIIVIYAFEKASDGQATKIIIPSEIQGIAGLAKSVIETCKEK